MKKGILIALAGLATVAAAAFAAPSRTPKAAEGCCSECPCCSGDCSNCCAGGCEACCPAGCC